MSQALGVEDSSVSFPPNAQPPSFPSAKAAATDDSKAVLRPRDVLLYQPGEETEPEGVAEQCGSRLRPETPETGACWQAS